VTTPVRHLPSYFTTTNNTQAGSVETTGFLGPFYADPTRELYHALGMTLESLALTPKGEKRKSYLRLTHWKLVVTGIWVCVSFIVWISDEG
jgi:hypothetical protein